MGKGGGGKSKKEIEAEMQMNRENQAAYERQAQANLEAAKVGANAQLEAAREQSKAAMTVARTQANATMTAAREQARATVESTRMASDATIKTGKMQADAAIRSSQNAAIGGIIGAALGAHTTHEEIKQWLPHETGAAMIQSWEMAQMWNKTISMRQAGYTDTAINWELGGRKGNDLFTDAQWRAMDFVQQTKQDMITNARMFGIQSASNPGGVPLSKEDWIMLHAMKDPGEILKVDPAMASQRQREFSAWEADMRSKGMGLIVDIYKNPQLGGSSILSMKGKDPLLDPALAPLIKGVMDTPAIEMTDINGQPLPSAASGQNVNWDQVIGALTKGEQNPHTAEINRLMEMGVIDKYGMVNAGAVMSFIPPHLQEAPPFNPLRELSPNEQRMLTDQYNQFASMNIDPKLIREEHLGFGVTRRQRLNPDGTVAAQALEGYMRNPSTGEPIFVSMQGQRLQEFYDRMSAIDLMGPTFPGMRAPVTAEQLSGQLRPGSIGGPSSVNTQWNAGAKGQPGQYRPAEKLQMTSMDLYAGAPKPDAGGAQKVTQSSGGGGGSGVTKPKTAGGTMGPAPSASSSNPAGYSGAPLAAGGE